MSLDYLEQYREFHKRKTSFNGTSCLRLWREIVDAADRYGCNTGLDFGCARGEQFKRRIWKDGRFQTLEELLGFGVFKYDPAIPEFAREPEGQFDIVWCVDVLNCMPESNVASTMDRLYGFTRKVLIVGVNSIECAKQLPDGVFAVQNYQSDEHWIAHVVIPAPGRIKVELYLD